jgi:hypothetical protein
MTDRTNEPLHPVARELAASGGGSLASYPPVERWDDWEEYDPVAWPRKVKRRYSLIPTICFNCEAGCGCSPTSIARRSRSRSSRATRAPR